MARERDDDVDDRDDRDDRDDDRPRRRSGGGRSEELAGMDKFMNSIVVAIIFFLVGIFCCPLISLILGGIGAASCKNPDSKRNSIIVLVGGVLGLVFNGILFATGNVPQN